MLIEQTGRLSAVILLDKNEKREKYYLLKRVYKALNIDESIGYAPKSTIYEREGKTLVFVELKPCAKIYCFDDNDAFIDAVRQMGKLCQYCELLCDGDKVYIKSKHTAAWRILAEYGRECCEGRGMYKLEARDAFNKLGGK